jgi:sulfatase maturation enzyme AslB (radical SAM superfamily)
MINRDFRHKPLDGDLLITMACPVGCDFCIYSCLPSMEPQKWMPEQTIKRVAEEYSKNDIGIRICGGEPFFDLKKLRQCIGILLDYYKPLDLNIITSAIFAGSEPNAVRNLMVLKETGLDRCIVSVDRFHLPRVPLAKIENVIKAAGKLGIDIVLRLSLDTESFALINGVSKIIVRYQTPIEVHSWGFFGRAESLDTAPLSRFNSVEQYIFKKIEYHAKKRKMPPDYRYYLAFSPKRTDRDNIDDFFPTAFPNGNVYARSYCFKSELMGNINTENLEDMVFRFWQTPLGRFLLSNRTNSGMGTLTPDKFKDEYDALRNEPLAEGMPEEAIGREFVVIKSDDDFAAILQKMNSRKRFHGYYGMENREFLLSFRFKDSDLWNEDMSLKIQEFLHKLEDNKIRFALSRPLPPCLKARLGEAQPKNCFECRELFTVENGVVKFTCDCLKGRIYTEIENVKNRDQIYEYFEMEHRKFQLNEICRSCLLKIRNQCNGMYFSSEPES